MTVREYLLMGGYADAVWPAYGVAILLAIVFAADSWRRLRRATARLHRLEAEDSVRLNPDRRRAAVAKSSENGTDGRAIPKPCHRLEARRPTSLQRAAP